MVFLSASDPINSDGVECKSQYNVDEEAEKHRKNGDNKKVSKFSSSSSFAIYPPVPLHTINSARHRTQVKISDMNSCSFITESSNIGRNRPLFAALSGT